MSAYQSALTVLGWCLLDSIWQMAVMWMGYKMVTAGNKRISPAAKHNLILLFVFIGTEWFVYSFIHLMNEPSAHFLPGLLSVSPVANDWISWLSVFYLVILTGRLIQYSFQYLRFRKNKNSKSPGPVYQAFADRYSKILGIHRKVQVYCCTLAETAETSRFFKPIILLPVSIISQLSPQQIEAIMVHELYHIRRNDYLTNICMSCYRGIFFFNPFAHLFYKELARERELACDDGVLELGFTPDLYAETLFSLEKFRQPTPGFSLAADGNKPWLLMERIRRVLGKPELRHDRFSPLMIISGLTALSLIILKPSVMVPGKMPQVVIHHNAFTPARYESMELKITGKIKNPAPKLRSPQRPVKTQLCPDIQSSPVDEPEETSDPPDMAYYADNKITRDYSNQPAADLSQDPVQVIPGSPYVPSVSLAYDAEPVIIAADSLRDIQVKNEIRTIVSIANLKAIANLKELEIQIDKNKQELTRIEIENQNLFLPDQRNMKPLLKKIQKQIESKKIQVDVLRNKLEVSEAEIIHI
ncbi:MAG TPA: M56 family metallopeptidase [Puia sp.]|nr:M56 family metallopeptidase [Puia sp.]